MSNKKDLKITSNLVDQTLEKLNEQMLLFKKELFNLRFQKKLGELKNTSRFLIIRKNIARIKTDLVRRLKLGDK